MSLADDLWELTADARWFGGRGRDGRLAHIKTLDPAIDVQSFLLDIRYADGAVEQYHVPLLHSHLPRLAEAVDEGLSLWTPFQAGSARFELLDDLPSPTHASRFKGEQSNTNVMFDNATMLKVLRRVEPGGGIEAEMLQALRGAEVAPELHGTWQHEDLALGVLIEAFSDPEDGYDMAVEHASDGRSFATHAEALGAKLSAMHRKLATELPTGEAATEALSSEFSRRYESAVRELPRLAEYRDALERVFQLDGGNLATQRVHGDCHLGQLLHSSVGWRYVDFEGEPMKSIAERRQPDSPARDVAGMLRSFGYARAAGDADDGWLTDCRSAFLAGYGDLPPALEAYEADKAVYEAIYESRFRPHLLDVPLGHLDSLTDN